MQALRDLKKLFDSLSSSWRKGHPAHSFSGIIIHLPAQDAAHLTKLALKDDLQLVTTQKGFGPDQ